MNWASCVAITSPTHWMIALQGTSARSASVFQSPTASSAIAVGNPARSADSRFYSPQKFNLLRAFLFEDPRATIPPVGYPIFDLSPSEDKESPKMYAQAMDELNDFFEIEWKLFRPRILIAPNRKILEEIREEETPDWVVGSTIGDRVVVLLSYEISKKGERTYIRSREDFYKLIKHELCHCFTSRVAGSIKPRWVAEGVSLYVADQIGRYPEPKKFLGFLDNNNIFQESGYVVDLLIKVHGKKKFLDFLHSLKNEKPPTAFKEVYELSLEYKTFDNLLSKVKKA